MHIKTNIAVIGIIFVTLISVFTLTPPVYRNIETNEQNEKQQITEMGIWSDRAYKKITTPSCTQEVKENETANEGFATGHSFCDRRSVTPYNASPIISTENTLTGYTLSYLYQSEREEWTFDFILNKNGATGYQEREYKKLNPIQSIRFWITTLLWPI